MTADTTPSLYDWAGGSAAFRALIDAFYDRVEGDDLLGPLFPGGVSEEHRANVALWWGEVFGGPADYTERLGGYERMLAHHRNLGITSEQRFRFASLMSLAADDARCRTIPNSGLPSSATWSGEPGWRSSTLSPIPRWSRRLRCRAGDGVSRRHTNHRREQTTCHDG